MMRRKMLRSTRRNETVQKVGARWKGSESRIRRTSEKVGSWGGELGARSVKIVWKESAASLIR
eukprot:753241-Hanusia_phi.AAC.4